MTIDPEVIKQEIGRVVRNGKFTKKNLSNLAAVALRAYPDIVREEVRKLIGSSDNKEFYAAQDICAKAGLSLADLAADKLLPNLDTFGFSTLLQHFLEANDAIFLEFLRVVAGEKSGRFRIIEMYEATEIIQRLSECEEVTEEILGFAEKILNRKGILDKPLDSYLTRSLGILSNHSDGIRAHFLICFDNLLATPPSTWYPHLKNVEIITAIKNVKEKEKRKTLVTKAILLKDQDLNKRIMREFRRYKKYFNLA